MDKHSSRVLLRLSLVAGLVGVSCAEAFSQAITLTPGVDYTKPNWANTKPIRKFVDKLPGLGPNNANGLGQYIPIAQKIANPLFPNDDYYELGLTDFLVQMNSDLPQTQIRGYYDKQQPGVKQYLGPLIIAQRDRPVRLVLHNELPNGSAGNLHLPVDHTYMGANLGPQGTAGPEYTENRADIHLHGGFTPWISDGTPHQWITPAGEVTPYKKGVSFRNVPDMVAPAGTPVPNAYPVQDGGNDADGIATYYYPNQQSGRLMFYHDHALGLTRLNVYAGEAAGYLLVDPVETDLINRGVLPSQGGGSIATNPYFYGIPLVVQDKTFVSTTPTTLPVLDPVTGLPVIDPITKQPVTVTTPATQETDPLWDQTNWGGDGALWFPHVYMPNQNPNDLSGANPTGRWDYGPWFWPPVPVSQPFPPAISGVPEAFMDTPIVNGCAYPYLNVAAQPYRFRILNACNDRNLNLSLFVADPVHPTEVQMTDAVAHTGYPTYWPTDGREGGVPKFESSGPEWFQIGTEGGILPAPVEVPAFPCTYNYNRRDITVLNVSNHSLLLGPAERADVVVDFTNFHDQTLILYNDCPAPIPAFDPRFDYFTGDSDHSMGTTGDGTGGAVPTLIGYGPNTRTILQFRVGAAGTGTGFNLTALKAELPVAFKKSQDIPLIPEPAFNDAMGTTAPATYSRIQDNFITFTPYGASAPVTLPLQPKAIHELFDTNYGRMNALLGYELPLTNFVTQTTIPLAYVDPPNEIMADGEMQVWKITHNGVDTHTIHFHLVNVQVINRVGWDGAIRAPDANEVGWKESVRMNPLEDIIVAVRAAVPDVPFALPDSVRPLDPTRPLGSTEGFTQGAMFGNNNQNIMYNFGQEYVWHCHLLGHEENDMMRPIEVRQVAPAAPSNLLATPSGNGIVLTWQDNSTNENLFRIQRDTAQTFTNPVYFTSAKNVATFTDSTAQLNTSYYYQVRAENNIGVSAWSNMVNAQTTAAVTAPSNLTATASNGPNTSVSLNWIAGAGQTAYIILRASDNLMTNATTLSSTVQATATSYTDNTAQPGTLYYYQVVGTNGTVQAASAVVGVTTRWVTTLAVTPVTGSLSTSLNLVGSLTSAGPVATNKAITFSIDGTLVGTANTDGTGKATLAYTIPANLGAGNHTIGAAFSSVDPAYTTATGSATLTATKVATTTTASLSTGTTTANAVVAITGKLTRTSTATAVTSKVLHFSVGGTEVGTATTDGNGVATYAYTVPAVTAIGTYPVLVAFTDAADPLYQTSQATVNLSVVSRLATTLTVTKVSIKSGNTGQLSATLMAGVAPVAGKTITFSVNGVSAGTATTNAQGRASVSYKAGAKGRYTITAAFDAVNDATYLPSNGTNTLTVN